MRLMHCLGTTAFVSVLTLWFSSELSAQDIFFTRSDYPAGDGPHSVFPVDLNEDGYDDLVTANFSL